MYILEPAKADADHELVLVEKESVKDGTAVLFEPGGTEKKVPKDRIVARLTPAPASGNQADRETAVAAINALLEAKSRAVALELTLQEEVEKWKKILDQMPNPEDPGAQEKAEAAFAEALAKAMPSPHDPATSYTREELAARIVALEQLKKEFPGKAQKIDEASEPWKMEYSETLAGRKKLEGRWLDPEEWAKEKGARERAARDAFLAKIEIPQASPVLLGQGLLLAAGGLALLAGFLGASFLFHGILEYTRHRAWWKGTAWALAGVVMVAVLGRATGLVLGQPEPFNSPTGSAESVEEMLWIYGAQKKKFPEEIKISDADLNAWLEKRLRFAPLKVTEILVLVAESWRLEMQDGTLRLDQTGRLLGRKFILRHVMTFSRSEQGEDIYRIEATLGKLPLPPAVVIRSWNQWTESLGKMAKAVHAADRLHLERIEKGAVVLSEN